MTSSVAEDPAARLSAAPFELLGRFADASNATLLVRLMDRDPRSLAEIEAELGREPDLDDLDPGDLAVHKPERGEAPLWDFPSGTLHRREVAAYEVACAMGWDLVPTTVLRDGGPFGAGSLQSFVPHDPALHYFRLLEVGADEVVDQLRRMVVFDLVIDNADRKAGHVLLADAHRIRRSGDDAARPEPGWPSDELPGPHVVVAPGTWMAGSVRLVDHGVSFNVERKLRTVAWEFAGLAPPQGTREAIGRLLAALTGELQAVLGELLDTVELTVLRERAERLGELRRLPGPVGDRPFPWPPI